MNVSRATALWLLPAWLLGAAACQDARAPGAKPAPAAQATRPPCVNPGRAPGGFELGQLQDGAACFELSLAAGEAVRFELGQGGGDLSTLVEGPDGALVLDFDTPVGAEAPERPCFVASREGVHHLRLAGTESTAPLTYSLRLLRQAPANGQDQLCFAAARSFVAASERLLATSGGAAVADGFLAAAAAWQASDEPLSAAMARREAARVLARMGRTGEAERQLRLALELTPAAASEYLELSLRNRLGLALLQRAEVEAAAELFTEVLVKARRAGDRRAEASALNNLALVDEGSGDVVQAIARLRQSAAIQAELGLAGDRAQTLVNLAVDLSLQDYHAEALDLLEQAQALARASGFADLEARCHLQRGWVLRLQGEPRAALAPLELAWKIWRSRGDVPGQLAALDRLGTARSEAGDQRAALAAYEEALRLARSTGDPGLAAPTTANLGCLYQEMGEAGLARYWLLRARQLYTAVPDPKARSHVDYCSALLSRRTGELEQALAEIEAALAIVETLTNTSRQHGARHRPIWLWQDYAEVKTALLVARAHATGDETFLAEAFSAADYTRARSLYEMVLESQLPEVATTSAAEEKQKGRLQLLGQARQRLQQAGAPAAELAALERTLAATSLELEELLAARRARDGRRLELAAPAPVELAAVQALLPPRALLLRYFLAEEQSFLFVVGDRSLALHLLPGRQVLERHAEALHQALAESAHGAPQAELVLRATAQLLLPQGVVPAGTSQLVIVADGALHYVPFAALPVPAPPGQAGDGERPLVDRVSLRSLPSAAVGLALYQRAAARPPAPRTLALFADPVFSDTDERLGASSPAGVEHLTSRAVALSRLPDGPLPRLPFTRSEAEAILALVPPDERFVALGFDASKAAALDPALGQFRILHFATHAFVDEEFPQLSGLVLSCRRPDGEVSAGNLHLHEILGMRLQADLAVLSGCQTALGKKVRGDGLLSLTRGFFYAGSSQVLVSLWSVDDEATAALMAEFYRAMLRDHLEPAEALRQAQRWMRGQERWKAPYFWAPFVIEGITPPR